MSTTLLCWCRNDSEVTDAARNFSCDKRYTGCRRAALPQVFGGLRTGDNLVITAHGAPKMLGEKDDSFIDLTANEFSTLFLQSVPDNWSGNVYFDICDGYAFARNVRRLLKDNLPNVRWFGCPGNTDMEVLLSKHQEATA